MTLEELRDRFRDETSYQDSEGLSTKIDGWLTNALRQHAPATSLVNLPESQVMPVILLAWVSLCYARAAKYANQGDSKGAGGYGTDRNTPYYKNMDMAVKLEDRYARLVTDLENTDPAGVIHQSDLVIRSRRLDTVVGNLPVVLIDLGYQAESLTSESVVLRLTSSFRSDFAELVVYHQTTPGIFQDWNYSTDDGVPQHSDAAERLHIFQYPPDAIKIEGLEPETLHYFVVVMHTTTGKYYYSNEVVVETPEA